MPRKALGTVNQVHQIKVGEQLTESIDGHAARKDSSEFVDARSTTHEIVKTLNPNPYGDGPVQCHHGGSLWVYDKTDGWRLFLNFAGVEWSAQFCCSEAKMEILRLNAVALTDAFPDTLNQLAALGYKGGDILTTPIQTSDDIARYVDSIWNSCVPIPQPGHTGSVKPASPLAAGVHNYPEPMCAIPRVMHDDFVPFVVDAATKKAAVVVPVAPKGSGDGRVRVLYAEPGHPLARSHARAHNKGQALVLSPDHPIARRAFRHQK
jgi:hypothetical protein